MLAKAPIQDGRYMVFGNVISGMETLRQLERLGSWKGATQKDVRIATCGQLQLTAEEEAVAEAAAAAAAAETAAATPAAGEAAGSKP